LPGKRDGLQFVHNALKGIGVRDQIRLIASGKFFSAFHMLRLMVLGTDTVNSARGMMMALGCIQSRSCNTDKCPTGVANYQHSSVAALAELLGILGIDRLEDLQPRIR